MNAIAKPAPRDARNPRREAIFDRDGVSLYWVDDIDGILEEIPWPCEWPKIVTMEFCRKQGYEPVIP